MANQSEKIRSINAVGWDGLNSTVQPFKNKTEQNDLDISFAQCFNTEAGQNVLKYFEKVSEQLPDYIKKNLLDMPNNKGYIWRGVCFYGYKKEQQGYRVLFEKQKGNILIIHEYTDKAYNRYEKKGKDKKQLIFTKNKII